MTQDYRNAPDESAYANEHVASVKQQTASIVQSTKKIVLKDGSILIDMSQVKSTIQEGTSAATLLGEII